MNNTYKIAIVGPRDTILGFKAQGVVPFEADNPDDALRIIREMRENIEKNIEQDRYGVVFVAEELLMALAPEAYEKVARGVLPAVLAIPGISGSKGFTANRIRELAKKALGVDVI